MAGREDIEVFLKSLKEKIKVFDVVFRPREKNLQALASLDITAKKRLDYIMNLKVEDYYAGPKNDTYNTALPDYYEFGIRAKGVEVYIKISRGQENKPVDCMSFHPSEYLMTYPLKQT